MRKGKKAHVAYDLWDDEIAKQYRLSGGDLEVTGDRLAVSTLVLKNSIGKMNKIMGN